MNASRFWDETKRRNWKSEKGGGEKEREGIIKLISRMYNEIWKPE